MTLGSIANLFWRSLLCAGLLLLAIGPARAGVGKVKAKVAAPAAAPAFAMVAAGDDHFVALGRDGSVWVWGDNRQGQLGLGNDQQIAALAMGVQIKHERPERLGEGFVHIGAYGNSTMAVKSDGSPYRAVFHYREQVAGTLHVYLLTANGQLDLIQVEHDDEGAKPLPVRNVGRDFVSVSSSYNLLIGLKADGSVWVWGHGYRGVPGLEDRAETVVVPQTVNFPVVAKGAQQ